MTTPENRHAVVKGRKITPKPIDLIGSILNHLLMVILITVVCFSIGSAAVLLKVKPSYTASAFIKIEPVIPKILYGKEEASITPYYDDFVNTQINIVKSFPVLSRAIEIYHEQGFTWQLPGETMNEAVDRLNIRMNAVQLRDTHLFTLSMFSRRKQGLAEIINAVATAFLEANQTELLSKDASRLSFLKRRKQEIEGELANNYMTLQNISAKYAVGITDEKNIYVYLQAIVDLTQQRVKATSRRIEVESKLSELEDQLEKLKLLDISADIDDWVEKDWAIRDNRIQLSRKLQDMRLILAGVNQNHPDRKEYEENLEKLYEVQDNLLKRAETVGEKVLRGKLLSDQNKKILELETEYAAAVNTEKKLESALKEAEQKATDVNTQMMKASTLRKNIQRLQDSLLSIDRRIDQIELESRSTGRIVLKSKARPPEQPAGQKRSKMMIIVVLFSLVSGVGYAIGRDKLDDKIYTMQDVERILGFPATGHIMDTSQEKQSITNLFRAVIDNPASQLSEQYKTISFALSREHEQHESQIYTCLAMSANQGVSSLICNVLPLLQGREWKKIFIDLNVWHPVTKSILPGDPPGLWDVLEGRCSMEDAIVTDSAFPFHILPFGNPEKEERSIFQETGVENLILALRMEYDYIMIDSPPLGLTTDGRFLARLADVAVLVARAETTSEKELFRAVDILDRLEVKVISVILNRIRFKKGKYYKSAMKGYYRLTHLDAGR